MIVCSTCCKSKTAESFYVRSDRPKGYTSACKGCRRKTNREKWTPRKQTEYKLKSNYGLSLDDYQNLLDFQGGVCAICKEPESTLSNAGYVKNLSVDHCHITGKVRGLLCHHCNTAIGKFFDRVDLLESAIRYLEEKL
jgi:hypothetical protein